MYLQVQTINHITSRQFLLVVEQFPARWGIVHHVYDKTKWIDIIWIVPKIS